MPLGAIWMKEITISHQSNQESITHVFRMNPDRKILPKILLSGLLMLSTFGSGTISYASTRLAGQQPGRMLQQIWTLIQQGNLNEARAQLNKGIKAYPTLAGFRVLLGIVEGQQKHFSAAEQNFKRSIQLNPQFASGYLNLGHLYQEQIPNDPDAWRKSVDAYKALLKVDPANNEGDFQLAILLEAHGQFQNSLHYLNQLPLEVRKQKRVLALSIADYAGVNDQEEAEVGVTKLLQLTDLTQADVAPVLAVMEAHNQEALETRLLSGLAANGFASLAALQRLGELYVNQGNLREARDTLEEVAVRDTHPVPALIELAKIADHQKDFRAALGYLARARDLEPTNAPVLYLFGMVCVQENLSQDAYSSLKQAVSLKPDDPYYNYALGAVILDREDANKAIPYFKKYGQLRPSDPRGKLGIGVAYFLSHDLASASKEFQSVEGSPQTSAGAHYFLGRIDDLNGDWAHAADELELAIKEQPEFPDAYAQLGLVRMNQKRYLSAEDAFRAAIYKDPDNYIANLNLMVVYQRMDDPRARAQEIKFSSIRKKRALMAKSLLRTVKVVP